MSWNRENTLKLIELYEGFPMLWNIHLPEYKDRYLKATASEKIANELGVSVEEVTRKLHNLRCQLNTELRKKKKKSGDGADDVVWKSSWEYFDNLKFITGFGGSNNNKTTGSINIKHEVEDLPFDDEDDLSSQGDHDSRDPLLLNPQLSTNLLNSQPLTNLLNPQPSTNLLNPQPSTNLFNFQPSTNLLNPQPSTSLLNPQPATSQLRQNNKRSTQTSTSQNSTNTEDVLLKEATVLLQKPYDEYTVFGDYVACELRQIRSKLRRNRLKRIIQRAIVEMGEEEDAEQFRNLPPSTPELSWSPEHN